MRHPLFALLVFLAIPSTGFSSELSRKQLDSLETFYRDLHENPELSGEETRTAAKVAGEFRKLGLETEENIGGHGVVGVLRNGPGPVILVRSELDALPVTEETGLSYRSKTEGKMHACGHDFHAAVLVGTAQQMKQELGDWRGTLLFVAQPAEEVVKGAKAMLADSRFRKLPKPAYALALHSSGNLRKGAVGASPGFVLAASDGFSVTFNGKGTHGASPELGNDPFIQAAEFVLKLQIILGREKEAGEPAVISVGSIHGGTKANIIPPDVKLQLTLRTYDPELRERLRKRIREVAFGIARTAGAPEPEVELHPGADPTYNDPALEARLMKALRLKLGAENVVDSHPWMASEDFGQFGRAFEIPSFFFMVGERNEKDPSISNHSPRFAPDFPGTAPLAIRAMVSALLELAPAGGKP
jgi:amidohydrolase